MTTSSFGAQDFDGIEAIEALYNANCQQQCFKHHQPQVSRPLQQWSSNSCQPQQPRCIDLGTAPSSKPPQAKPGSLLNYLRPDTSHNQTNVPRSFIERDYPGPPKPSVGPSHDDNEDLLHHHQGFLDSDPVLMPCNSTTGGIKVDRIAAQTWECPATFPARESQLEAVQSALLHNTLVCLPTGLGQTLIASVVMHNFARWFPEGKIVFIAPTRPLVEQQMGAFIKSTGVPEISVQELTGKIDNETRKDYWLSDINRYFFATPQTFWNDVRKGICPYDKVVCLVIDQCHTAVGEADIARCVKFMKAKRLKFRVLGLSATPGASVPRVQEVIENLMISEVVCRTETDVEVGPYVHQNEIELAVVETSDKSVHLQRQLTDLLQRALGMLTEMRAWNGTINSESVHPHGLQLALDKCIQASKAAGGKNRIQPVEMLFQAATLASVRDVFDQEGPGPAFKYLESKEREPMMHTIRAYMPAYSGFRSCLGAMVSTGGARTKMQMLVNVLQRHCCTSRNGRVIVSTSLRDSVQNIVHSLKAYAPLISARAFIGQGGGTTGSSNANAKSGRGGGMTQKEQKTVLKDFSASKFNVLVCTCVGEEGLDIPAVDLIVCIDAAASPVRSALREGRTGRHGQGKIMHILSAGKELDDYKSRQEALTGVLTQLGRAHTYFQLHTPNPRLLPLVFRPKKIVVDLCGQSVDCPEKLEKNEIGNAHKVTKGRQKSQKRNNKLLQTVPAETDGAVLPAMRALAALKEHQHAMMVSAPSSPSQASMSPVLDVRRGRGLLFEESTEVIRFCMSSRKITVAPPSITSEMPKTPPPTNSQGPSHNKADGPVNRTLFEENTKSHRWANLAVPTEEGKGLQPRKPGGRKKRLVKRTEAAHEKKVNSREIYGDLPAAAHLIESRDTIVLKTTTTASDLKIKGKPRSACKTPVVVLSFKEEQENLVSAFRQKVEKKEHLQKTLETPGVVRAPVFQTGEASDDEGLLEIFEAVEETLNDTRCDIPVKERVIELLAQKKSTRESISQQIVSQGNEKDLSLSKRHKMLQEVSGSVVHRSQDVCEQQGDGLPDDADDYQFYDIGFAFDEAWQQETHSISKMCQEGEKLDDSSPASDHLQQPRKVNTHAQWKRKFVIDSQASTPPASAPVSSPSPLLLLSRHTEWADGMKEGVALKRLRRAGTRYMEPAPPSRLRTMSQPKKKNNNARVSKFLDLEADQSEDDDDEDEDEEPDASDLAGFIDDGTQPSSFLPGARYASRSVRTVHSATPEIPSPMAYFDAFLANNRRGVANVHIQDTPGLADQEADDSEYEDSFIVRDEDPDIDTPASHHHDECALCGADGELLLCDGCPQAFHLACLHMQSVPPGQWYCPLCLVEEHQSDEEEGPFSLI